MRRLLRAIGAAACLMAFTGARAAAPADRPAIWRTYDLIVSFQSLPRTYTCDQLWYEFHGILLRLGAPLASIDILPYRCSPTPAGDMKSPHVEARFQLPFVLMPGVKGAPIQAVERAIRLAPGKPKTLHASDCQLLRQIDQTMLASMPVELSDAHFDCSAPPPRSAGFAVTVTLPVVAHTAAAAAAAPSRAGSGIRAHVRALRRAHAVGGGMPASRQ